MILRTVNGRDIMAYLESQSRDRGVACPGPGTLELLRGLLAKWETGEASKPHDAVLTLKFEGRVHEFDDGVEAIGGQRPAVSVHSVESAPLPLSAADTQRHAHNWEDPHPVSRRLQ